MEMVFACKKCKKCFRKDMNEFDESDEFCPHCDNHFVIEAKEPKARLEVEGEDVRKDARMLRDERNCGRGSKEEKNMRKLKDWECWDSRYSNNIGGPITRMFGTFM